AGSGLAGAMMPSVDKMGRYFPLLAFAVAPQGADFALPSLSDDAWYHDLETALLSTLTQDAELEPLLAALDSLTQGPRAATQTRRVDGSLWWSLSADNAPPHRAAWPELPPPTAFADMLRPPPPAPASAQSAASP
ncbi:MAG: type VI secretion system-associated protein TagF, partial [Pseudomonadota bacterium]